MAKKFLTNLDLAQNELQNPKLQNLAAAPSNPVAGQPYWDTTLKKLGIYNGTAWDYIGLGNGTVTSVSVATANGLAGTVATPSTTPTITFSTTVTGLLKGDGTGISAAIASTDYAPPTTGSSALKGNGSGGFAAATLNDVGAPTSSFSMNSQKLTAVADPTLAQDAATKNYVDSVVSSNTFFAGNHDASGGALPTVGTGTAGAIRKGDFWIASVAGTITGLGAIEVGDQIFAKVNGAAIASDFFVVQTNLGQATTSVRGYVTLATQAEAEAKSDPSKTVTPSSLANFPIKKTFTIGDGVATVIACTHNLGTKDVITQIRESATDAVVEADIVNGTNSVTITFATAPASNGIKVVIIG